MSPKYADLTIARVIKKENQDIWLLLTFENRLVDKDIETVKVDTTAQTVRQFIMLSYVYRFELRPN